MAEDSARQDKQLPDETGAALRKEREWLRVTLASIGDGVLATDTQGRVTYLNAVAQSLTGWTQDEAAGKPLDRVFPLINEQTRQAVENPALRVLREGVIVGLANHTVLIARDRTERPIDDSAAPIKDEQGKVAGVVLVFRDVTERRKAELLLEKARTYDESVVETVRTPLLILTAGLRVKTANRSFYQTFHVTREETQDRLIYQLGNGQWNIPRLRSLLEDILPQNTSFDYEVEFDFPAIGPKNMLLNARRLYREGNHTELILLAIEDITERKQANEGLKIYEIRYRRLFESAKDGILILDADTAKITDANPFIGELLGYAHADLIGKELWQIGLFQDIAESKAAVRELQEKHYIRYEDLPLETRTGRRIDVEFVSTVYSEDHQRVIQCNIRDITERKRIEEALRKTEQRLASLIESSNDAIITKSLDGIIQSWNAAAERLFGYTAAQAVGRPITLIIPADRAAEEERIIACLVAGDRVEHFDTVRVRSDGQSIQVSLTISPIRDAAGRVVGASKIARDITDRKRFEAELREADRRKNEFLALLAHELRNPLAPVRNALQILRLTGADGQTLHAASAMMERQIGHLVRLVDDLLDVSRISRGKIELRRERVELAAAVNQAVEAVRALYRDHELTITLPPQPVYLNADPTRLAQVVSNLLNNACKFSDRGGRISLTVERAGEQMVMCVRDNGIGIAADQLPRIFDMFMQVDTSLERSVSGLGIGLTLVKSLVEMHGGTVTVHSGGVGHGSEFVVRLPILVAPPEPRPPELTVRVPTTATGCRILVVDDNRDSATSLALLLQLTGNEAHLAYDGLEAVATAATFRPDVILLDIGLPKLNGHEACRRIREQPWGKGMLLVALTGWGQDEDREKSKETGFDAHMVKPVDFATLQELLTSLKPAGN